MNKQKNIEKLIFETFDNSIKGTDIYNHDGSMWLIFTEERKWVVEFTKEKTLWYNYKHFTDILVLFGMELTEGAEYIKKWYEDKLIFNVGKNSERYINKSLVDDIIYKGVKQTELSKRDFFPKDVLQNGVKEIKENWSASRYQVEDTIENGVKETISTLRRTILGVDDIIKNGVKHSEDGDWLDGDERIENIIQNGVKQ